MRSPCPTCLISVIIPAINERDHIERAVRGAWRAGADQVIVSDGGSCDGTPALARRHQAIVVAGPAGRGRQQNLGARQAAGDILVFQHADSYFGDGALAALRPLHHNDGRYVLGAFRQRIESDRFIFRLIEQGNALRAAVCQMPYGDQAIFVSRTLFNRCHGFPDVPLMEEVLFIDQARRYARPRLMPGPIHVDTRRWMRHGIVRQTIRNWSLLLALRLGVSPHTLAGYYLRHDVPRSPSS